MKKHPALLALAVSLAAAGLASAQSIGPSTSQSSYVLPVAGAFSTTSILSVGDLVSLTGGSAGQTFKMVGIPDGLGAYDNGNGTFTLLMNHELGNTSGAVRSHGAAGAFVSEFIINKSSLQVVSGSDLMKNVYNWDATNQVSLGTTSTFAFNRFCSGDLAPTTAFYNPATGLGSQARIYLNGEEGGATGYEMAHIATGASKGNSYVLGKFNLSTNGSGLSGVGSWENTLANPFPQNKTIVIGNNDGGTGIMTNAVSVYVGAKTNVGTEADKAGLTNGTLKFISVTGNPVEITNTTTRATGIANTGTPFTLSSTASTTFSRPEDGAWNPLNLSQYYFVTTDRLDMASDNLGAQIGQTRLWRLNFTDITNPDLGGTIDLLVDGDIVGGQKVNMFDNMTVGVDGHIFLQEDVGGAAHNGKVWEYNPTTDSLTLVLKHDPARFGDVNSTTGAVTAATSPFNNDEETSGIIDISSIMGVNGTSERWLLSSDQAHYLSGNGVDATTVEGGQLLAIHVVPEPNSALLLLGGAGVLAGLRRARRCPVA